jgi:large repetitive protein
MKKIIILLFLSIIWYYTSINAGIVSITYNAWWLPSATWGVIVVPNTLLSGIVWAQTGQMWGVRIGALQNATPFYFRQDGTTKEFQLHINNAGLAKVVQVKLIQSWANIAAYISYARYNWLGSLGADFDVIASNTAPIAVAWWAWYWSPLIRLLVDDTTIPIVTLSWSANITIAQWSSYTDSGARWTDNLDGSWTLYTWTWWTTGSFQVSGTVNTAIIGTYILEYQKIDRWGNKSAIITRTVQVTDQTPPDTTITSGIFSWALTNISSQDFTFISNETWSTFQCKIDSSVWQTCISPFTTWYSDWTHTIFVRAIDSANNIDSTPASRTFIIDTTPPTSASVTVNIDSPYGIDNPQISFTGSYDIHFSHYEISVDWWSFSTQNSPYIPWSLVSWSHIVIVRSYDSVWNYSEAEVKFPPVAQIIAPTTLSSGTITDTTIIINGISWDLVQSITFSGVWLWFNCGSLPQAVPITCTWGTISTGWIFEVYASNGVVTGKTAQMYIIDTIAPLITLNNNTNITIAHGSSYIDSGASWSDNIDWWDSTLTGIWWELSSFSISWTVNTNIIGTYIIEYQKVDRVGNKTLATRTIQVTDQTPPIVTLNGSWTIDVLKNIPYTDSWANWIDNIDGNWVDVIVSGSVDTWVVGTYIIEYNKIDSAGNTWNIVTRKVNVILGNPPIINLSWSDNINIEVHTPYTDTDITANDTEQWNMTSNIMSSWSIDIHTLWTYSIEYTLTDAQGNNAIPVTRTINVIDTTSPIISLSWGNNITTIKGYIYVDTWANCTDNYDNICTIIHSWSVNTWVIGTYSIEYNAIDNQGNNATWVIRTVQVISGSIPVITLNGSGTLTIAQNSTYTDSWATAIDNEDWNITANIVSSWTVNTNVLWTYTIIYNVIDISGNPANTITRTVQVTDQTPPLTPTITSIWWDNNSPYKTPDSTPSIVWNAEPWSLITIIINGITYTGYTNNTGLYDIIISPALLDGSYNVIITATDSAGNISNILNKSFIVDTTPPQLTLQWANPLIIQYWSTLTDPGAIRTDAVDGSWIVMWVLSWDFTTTIPGTYSIVYSYTDSVWNVSLKISRTIVVQNPQYWGGREYQWWSDESNNNTQPQENSSNICWNSSTELEKAYCFARKNDITTINTLLNANATWSLIRKDLAKMMVNFSRNVLWTVQNTTTSQCKNNYNDVSRVSKELRTYIELACSMNIMWLEADWRTPLSSFRPSDYVTRAEFATVLSRVLYGNTYDVWLWSDYVWYEKHLSKLNTEWFINNITEGRPLYIEKRWYTWIILERVSKKKQ